MRAVLASRDLLEAAGAVLPGVTWHRDRMRAALSPDLFATAEALDRVRQGEPFRDAYRAVGTDLGALAVPADEDALAAYRTLGTPGHAATEALRQRLAARDAAP